MAAVSLPPPPIKVPFLDGLNVSQVWLRWFEAVRDRLGGSSDKVEEAWKYGAQAAPATAEVVAIGGLHGGGAVGGNTALALYVSVCTVDLLPATAGEGDLAYAQDGRRGSQTSGNGTGVPCWYSGGSWFAIDSGSAVAA
ncbi:MAG TPA: hypothetical protein VG248_02750 [Caulobacteraceae bacterium]|jgi:hypothetical protein|nr:hypothetical protein [Caulobacteraceae bacterium]